jgi:hypothetical protein
LDWVAIRDNGPSVDTRQHFLIKGSFLVEIDLNTLNIIDETIMNVQSVYPGLPKEMDASFYDRVKNVQHFFKDKWYGSSSLFFKSKD